MPLSHKLLILFITLNTGILSAQTDSAYFTFLPKLNARSLSISPDFASVKLMRTGLSGTIQ